MSKSQGNTYQLHCTRFINTTSRSAYYQVFTVKHGNNSVTLIHFGKLTGPTSQYLNVTRPVNGGTLKFSKVGHEAETAKRMKDTDYVVTRNDTWTANDEGLLAMFGATHVHQIGVLLGLVGGNQNPVVIEQNKVRALEIARELESDPLWGSW
jgi:hypothetical protein